MCLETWLHGSLSAKSFQWKGSFHQPSIRPCLAAMIMFANIPRVCVPPPPWPRKARYLADGQHEGQGDQWPNPGWFISNRLVQLLDLRLDHLQQCQQILAPMLGPPSRGSISSSALPRTLHSWRFFCTPGFSARCCNSVFNRVRTPTNLRRCANPLRTCTLYIV